MTKTFQNVAEKKNENDVHMTKIDAHIIYIYYEINILSSGDFCLMFFFYLHLRGKIYHQREVNLDLLYLRSISLECV